MGYRSTAAIRTNGTLWAWGNNCQGQLGNNSVVCRSSPVSVVGGFTDWCQVRGGQLHTAAIRTNGTLWTWGWNNNGQLGDNSQTNRSSPVSIVGGFTNWCQLSAGSFASGAVRTNGELWMWGAASAGTLGDNTINNSKSSPISVIGGINSWSQVSIGCIHVVAITSNSFIRGFDTP
jgi:alpha-tubulin suppressor-like RCC1 family protein